MPVPSETPQREHQHAPVHADQPAVLPDARESGGVDGEQRANADDAEDGAEHAAGERQDDALGEQLTHDAAAAGANCRPDSDLSTPAGRAHEQQVGNVRARNQQDEADGTNQYQQRRTDVRRPALRGSARAPK